MTRLTDERFEELVRLGSEAWERCAAERGALFHPFLPADPQAARELLAARPEGAETFLELGSGVGVITIVADLLGYDAYGIEIVPELVTEAEQLAAHFGSRATFVEGSFVPPELRDDVDLMSADFLTVTEGIDAYDELGMTMADFDLVYAFPLPGEEDWTIELVRRCAGPRTSLVCFSNRDGFVHTELER